MDSNEKNIDMMTQEEIERFLEQQQNKEEQFSFDDADLASLLSELENGDDDDIQEISDLLNKADNNEAVADDVVELMKKQEAEGENAYDAMDLFSNGETEKKEGFFKRLINKLKSRKSQKQVHSEEQQDEVKEEAEETDDIMDAALAMLNSTASSETNVAPVSEQTEKKPAKKKKEKKVKEKKPKKSKKGKVSVEIETISEEDMGEIKEKPGKKKKEKKEKKVKEKKSKAKKGQNELDSIREKTSIEDAVAILEEEDSDEMPNKKKIIIVFVAAVMIMLGYLVVNYYFTRHANKQLAEEAYEAEDYLECYQLMYGQKLNDSQAAMFHRSELILKMDIFWSHYNEFMAQQKQLEGLDELVQFVYEYPKLSAYAAEWNCLDTVEGTYTNVIGILSEDYEVSEQDALDIAALESDVDYTKALTALIAEKQKNDEIEQKYPDILPQEQDRVTQE